MAHSSVELGGRSDIAIACSSPCWSFILARVEAILAGSTAAILVERTKEQLAVIRPVETGKKEKIYSRLMTGTTHIVVQWYNIRLVLAGKWDKFHTNEKIYFASRKNKDRHLSSDEIETHFQMACS